MTNDKGIYIKNIYYMLSYAFRALQQTQYESVQAEDFEQVQDLFAAILARGVSRQVKQGLCRAYVTKTEDLSMLRGRLELAGTIRNRIHQKVLLTCELDELSEDTQFNQILKTTMHCLMRDSGVSRKHKEELGRVLLYFRKVSFLKPSSINWNQIRYHRNDKSYELLLNLCYFVLHGMLQTTEQGSYRLAAFSDKDMAKLFEKFILEYYRRHHTYLSEAKAAKVKWDLTGDQDHAMTCFLPDMQTDVFLRLNEKVLILDAKYYAKTMQTRHEKQKLYSRHLYQIYTYVKNQDTGHTGNVSGMLVYAKTQEALTPDCLFDLDGNKIGAVTLDLNQEFHTISMQLDQIAKRFFGKHQTE